jgi:hypothetical protein
LWRQHKGCCSNSLSFPLARNTNTGKKIDLSLWHDPNNEEAADKVPVKAVPSKGWFGFGGSGSSSADSDQPNKVPLRSPVFIGMVSFELKNILNNPCALGSMKLMDPKGRKPVGGEMRLCVRTGREYGGVEGNGENAAVVVGEVDVLFEPYRMMVIKET